MEFGEILIAMTAVVLGCTIVLIPLVGLTARFAVKPLLDSWVRARETPLGNENVQMLERRVSALEKQIQILERDNARLLEDAEFRERLRG